ncbi:MAG: tetratricopeptide repeat protein [Syntrophales bacterium]
MVRGSKRKGAHNQQRTDGMPPGAGKSEVFWRKPAVHNVLIVILGILVYSNSFNIPVVFDDIPNIVDNSVIKDIGRVIGPQGLKHNRPVTQLTFALNYRMHGLEVTGYHIFNLVIHLLNALLVYWLTALTFRTAAASPYLSHDSAKTAYPHGWVPLFAALVFVSHPIQTQAVSYIVQRSASLATLFYLLSLVAYVKARGFESARKARYALYAASIISAVLAMKSKEIAFTLPVMVLLYELLFFPGDIKKQLLYLFSLLLTMLIIPFSYGLFAGAGLIDSLTRIADSAAIPRWDYLNTQFRVIVTYIRLLLLPVDQNLDYDYPLYRTFLTPPVFLSFLFLSAIFCGAIFLLYRSYAADRITRCRYRVIVFGVFWFFVTLSVESSIIPITDVINEHRLYLPSVGFFLAIIAACAFLYGRLTDRGRIVSNLFRAIMILLVIGLSLTAHARNRVWQDEMTLWQDVVKKSPHKLRPHYNLGESYLKQGRFADAIREFQTALDLKPDQAQPHYNLGMAYQKQGRLDDAIKEYQTALDLDPNLVKPHHNLGAIYQNRGYLDDAIKEYTMAIKLNPGYPASYYNRGVVYQTQGRLDDAIREYRTVLNLKPDHADAHNDLGAAYESQGLLDAAAEEYRAALRINPDHTRANNNLRRVTKHAVRR